jgi:hypothetical protein
MPIDVFVGTAEIKEAMLLVGWIAVNHARVEDMLDYLRWHLECFELESDETVKQMSENELQEFFRTKIPERGSVPIRVKKVQDYLTRTAGAVARRLNEYEEEGAIKKEWPDLGARIKSLSTQRNAVVHSTISWSAGGLVRHPNWDISGQHTPVDLRRDEELRNDLGNLATDIGSFATRLGRILPFRANCSGAQS